MGWPQHLEPSAVARVGDMGEDLVGVIFELEGAKPGSRDRGKEMSTPSPRRWRHRERENVRASDLTHGVSSYSVDGAALETAGPERTPLELVLFSVREHQYRPIGFWTRTPMASQ